MSDAHPLLKITFEFEGGGARHVVASLSIDADAADVFDALLEGCRQLSAANDSRYSSYRISVYARSKDPSHETLLHDLVERWNALGQPPCSALVEVSIGCNAQSWYGVTNGSWPDDPEKRSPRLRYFTYEEMSEVLSRHERELVALEREQRRSKPVRKPVILPPDIADQLARYLKREFPELDAKPHRLTAKRLTLAGELPLDGVPTQFWQVAGARPELWGVVERFEDSYNLSFTANSPEALRH